MKSEELSLFLDCLNFLNYEAILLDDNKFDQWLQLLSDDFEYEVPVRYSSNEDVEKEFSSKEYLIKGGKDYFRATFERLKDSYGWAAKQRSRTRRYVTNVHISEVKKGDGEVIVNVRSNVLLIRTERDSPISLDAFSSEKGRSKSGRGKGNAKKKGYITGLCRCSHVQHILSNLSLYPFHFRVCPTISLT
jgi:Small subunit of phenylpropionate dioxygenase